MYALRLPLLPGHYYHIFNFHNSEEPLFRETDNYIFFLRKYEEFCRPVTDTFAYCLMPYQFHFFVRIRPTADLFRQFGIKDGSLRPWEVDDVLNVQLSRRFANLFNSYAKAYNRRYGRQGSLFTDYFKRKEIDAKACRRSLIRDMHLQPVAQGLCGTASQWPHSSWPVLSSDQPTYLCRDELLEWFGGRDAFLSFHSQPPPVTI
ncbi:hypothetical protein [Larkinella soli]|uniref:hypothetical protein n=1 Tax=Larkinella soli TaxID=1770527 RepID=UPI000FFCC34D|nr:hypothetical protein [Larkinella soli]